MTYVSEKKTKYIIKRWMDRTQFLMTWLTFGMNQLKRKWVTTENYYGGWGVVFFILIFDLSLGVFGGYIFRISASSEGKIKTINSVGVFINRIIMI